MVLPVLLLLSAAAAQAQQNSPTIGYVYPAGGKRGTTFEVTVGGQFLRDVASVAISGQGVRAEIVDYSGPLQQKQIEELREKARQLRQRRQAAGFGRQRPQARPGIAATQPDWSESDEAEMAQVLEKLDTFARTRAVPALSDMVTLKVTIDADASPGRRTLRLESAGGLTNPMVFCVGRLPEFARPVAKGAERFGIAEDGIPRQMPRRDTVPNTPIDITLPAVVNGQITAGGRDRWQFTARKGQRIVVSVRARQLLPYLADAVPGWFQALVSVHDAQGQEIACADHYRFDPDPVLSCIIPANGQYTVEIADALYRGREDFVYRITIGQLPFVTSVFPLGGPTGSPTIVQLTGWNLPKTSVTMNGKDLAPGVYPLWDGSEPFVNSVPFAVGDMPECLKNQPCPEPAKAQPVTLPVIVNGWIEQPGVWDVFSFQGHAGQTVVAEVTARRLGSPLDSAVKITDAAGKQLAFNDDYPDPAAGLLTHQADSWLMVKLPADGTYYVHLCDIQRRAGREYAYRLRLSEPRPDFDLRVTPSAINIRRGETVPITVHVIRRDGFDGQVSLSLKDPPNGLVLKGGSIPARQDQARVTLSAARSMSREPLTLIIEGHARIGGREIAHKAAAADDQMQAFAYHHLVPAADLDVCIADRPFPRESGKVLSETPIRIPIGGEASVEVALPSGPLLRDARVELSDPPEGIHIDRIEPIEGGICIVLAANLHKVKPGLSGNLVFSVYTDRTVARGGQGNKRRFSLGTLPAVPFMVTKAE